MPIIGIHASRKTRSPSWVTSAGQLGGTNYTLRSVSTSVSATTDSGLPIVYSINSGALPSGLSLNTNTGAITGTINDGAVSDFTTNNTISFTIRAAVPAGGADAIADRTFNLRVDSYYAGYSCMSCNENGTASMTAPGGYQFTRIDFSSYGTPNGGCGAFTLSGCHVYVGLGTPSTSYTVNANNGNYGDPCGGTFKRYYGQASYSLIGI